MGGCFGFLIGHGSRHEFTPWMKPAADGSAMKDFRAADAAGDFASAPPTPPLAIYTCSSGDFAGPDDCLAESLFRMPGGPAAVIAASTESHPMTNSFSVISHLRILSKGTTRLGDLWLAVQREAHDARDFVIEKSLLHVEGSLDGEIDQDKLRRDQALMYNILGDPAMNLKLPNPMKAQVAKHADGWTWTVAPPAGTKSVHAAVRTDSMKHRHRTDTTSTRSAASEKRVPDTSASLARAAYEKFDSAFEFEPIGSPAAKGEIASEGFVPAAAGPGLLRLVATDDRGVVAVCAIQIK
jgi:hypothetical protein